jgi:zinc transporter
MSVRQHTLPPAVPDLADDAMPGFVWAFRFRADGSAEELPDCAALEVAADPHGWLWVHCNLADVRLAPYLRTHAKLPEGALDLVCATGEHQQLHVRDTCVYGVFADLVCDLDGLTDKLGSLHFAVSAKLVLTGRREALNAPEAMRKSLRKGRRVENPAALLEAIVEKVAGGVEARSADLADELDRIEEQVIVDASGDHPRRLARVRRLAVRLHRLLATQRALINRFEHRMGRLSHRALHLDTGKLAQRLDWLDHEIVALRDRAHLLQEEVSLKMTDQTNRNLQVLAIVTTVFLPASLIAAIFGMNVGGLPLTEDRGGFVSALLLLAGVSALVYWMLKRWGLLRR